MIKTYALVNCFEAPGLGELTDERPLASTTFLARYAFIDITLSNLTNSGIDNIAILVKNRLNSIAKHVKNQNTYLTNPRTGSLSYFLKTGNNHVFNTDIQCLRSNDPFLFEEKYQYVMICDPSYIFKADYSSFIEEHVKSGRRMSAVYTHISDGSDFKTTKKFVINSLGDVQRTYFSDENKPCDIGTGIIIVERELLKELLETVSNISKLNTITDLFDYAIKYSCQVHAIRFDGYMRRFESFEDYYKYSMELLNDQKLLKELIYDEPTIYTTTHNSRPVLYGKSAKVTNSIIANGSTINGKVKNSIISRDVVIEEGATVENSIIFTHTIVKKGVHLKNVVSDKRVVFQARKEVQGTEEEPLYFPRGAKI